MSTFDGVVEEFPGIRIDYFRNLTQPCRVRASFLSHIHSDHLAGLESYTGPFIYCSSATREMLLCFEKYSNRMNFARGVLEQRKQTYLHLDSRLKAIPLDTPVLIELEPNWKIRVTLFDANHCPGSVMFLIEDDGKAILYTGDVRAEDWWVRSLARSPLLLPYLRMNGQEPLKRLDNIYLDTTFASKSDQYRQFPSKAQGIAELLREVSQYPKCTKFYFDTWTFGYEDVWQALSSFLQCRIHVNSYRYRFYMALAQSRGPSRATEGFTMFGAQVGNHFQEGCLSTEAQRIHSCERGTECDIWKDEFVRITPIVTRHEGVNYGEIGAGGGYGDLTGHHELEIEGSDTTDLLELCEHSFPDRPTTMARIKRVLKAASKVPMVKIPIDANDMEAEIDEASTAKAQVSHEGKKSLPLNRVVDILASYVNKLERESATDIAWNLAQLPKQITFPFSRHSSYGEMCSLVDLFKPRDVFPCTVDRRNWTPQVAMSHLFGHIYEPDQRFSHDQRMHREHQRRQPGYSDKHPQDVVPDCVESQEYEDKLAVSDSITSRSSFPQHLSSIIGDTQKSVNTDRCAYSSARSNKRDGICPQDSPEASTSSTVSSLAPHQKLQNELSRQQEKRLRLSEPKTNGKEEQRVVSGLSEAHEQVQSREQALSKMFANGLSALNRSSPKRKKFFTKERSSSSVPDSNCDVAQSPANQRRPSPCPKEDPGIVDGDMEHDMPTSEDYHDRGRSDSVQTSSRVSHGTETQSNAGDDNDVLCGDALRNALKQEVYDSVRGRGLDWAEIGLVTVTPHEKEEEL